MSPLHQDYFAPSFKMNVKIDFNDEIELDCLKKKITITAYRLSGINIRLL